MTGAVPVVWFNTHQDECNPRAHWDCALLTDLFDGKVWQPPDWPGFVHLNADDDAGPWPIGAVVMVPGNFHRDDVDALNYALAPLSWVLVVLTSDEDSSFPWAEIRHPNAALWIMTPRSDRHPPLPQDPDAVAETGAPPIWRYLGEGYQPGTPERLAAIGPWSAVGYDAWFHGRDGHARRDEMMNAARRVGAIRTGGRVAGGGFVVDASFSPGFTQGLPPRQYLQAMLSTRTALCPSGLATPDSFRVYEALECGTLPIADAVSPAQPSGDYWTHLTWPSPAPPFPKIGSWDLLPMVLTEAVGGWPDNANRAAVWWQHEKRRMAYDLRDHVARLRDGTPFPDPAADDPFTRLAVHADDFDTVASIRVNGCASGDENVEITMPVGSLDPLTARTAIWRCAHGGWGNVLPTFEPDLAVA